jgi:hypothetical protein
MAGKMSYSAPMRTALGMQTHRYVGTEKLRVSMHRRGSKALTGAAVPCRALFRPQCCQRSRHQPLRIQAVASVAEQVMAPHVLNYLLNEEHYIPQLHSNHATT